MSEQQNRVFATPKRRLNRSSSNLSAGESRPSPLSNFSFTIPQSGSNTTSNTQPAFGGNPSVNTQQQPQQQQQPLFGSKPNTTNNFSFGGGAAAAAGNTPASPFGGTSKPLTTFGTANTSASPFGGTSTSPSQSSTITSPFGNVNSNSPSTSTAAAGTSPFANINNTSPVSAIGGGGASSPFGNIGATGSNAATKSPFGSLPNVTTTTSSTTSATIPTFGSNTNTSTSAPTFSIPTSTTTSSTTPATSTAGGGFSFSTTTTTPPTTSNPFSFGNNLQQQQSKDEEKKTNESSDGKKENVPLFGALKDDSKKDNQVPAFSFKPPTKNDDTNTGLFGKPTTPLFTPLNTNHKREHSVEESEPSAKKTMFSFKAPSSTTTGGESTSDKKEEEKGKETEKKKEDDKPTTTTTTTEPKKVTFNFGSNNKKDDEDKTTTTSSTATKEPSISLAFSTKKDSKDDSTTLSVSATSTTSTSESSTPVIRSNITDPNQITKKTFFWELPEVAQKELASFNHFITSQADKLNQAALDTEFTIGSRVRAMKTESSNLNNDAEILLKQLGYLNEKVNDLILKNNTHRVNITAAQLMQQQEVKHWRLRGAAENWSYFKDMVDVTRKRLDTYKESINAIEETVLGLQNNAPFSPSKVGYVMESQGKMLISLAGRIAEVHEQVERIVSQHKPNSRSSVF